MRYKALTLRLPEEIYAQVVVRETTSITAYIVDAVVEKVARDREAALASGFATLAGPLDDESAQWIAAQAEAMKGIDD